MTGCEQIRVALSAHMDGEESGVSPAGLESHLAGCADCRSWRASAELLTRAVRVQSVEVPDLTTRILTAVAAENTASAKHYADTARERRRVLQIALAISAVVQLVLAIPAMLGGIDVHTSREAASFDIALAVGFALAAWRPERARAFVPVAFVLAGCLTLTSAFDIAGGATIIAHEMSHLAALAQAFILLALSRGTKNVAPMPRPRQAATS
jgi:predicted anti-sigma-YlaC factor YlaD